MQPNFRMLSLIPAGLAAECIVDSGDAIEVTARAEARVVRCPFCGSPSHPVRLVVASSMDGLAAGQGGPMAAFPFRSHRSLSKIRPGRRSPRPRHVVRTANQIRTYRWCNPPRNGLSRMRPALTGDSALPVVTPLAQAERQRPHRTREKYLLDLFPAPSRDGCVQRHHRALFDVG